MLFDLRAKGTVLYELIAVFFLQLRQMAQLFASYIYYYTLSENEIKSNLKNMHYK